MKYQDVLFDALALSLGDVVQNVIVVRRFRALGHVAARAEVILRINIAQAGGHVSGPCHQVVAACFDLFWSSGQMLQSGGRK